MDDKKKEAEEQLRKTTEELDQQDESQEESSEESTEEQDDTQNEEESNDESQEESEDESEDQSEEDESQEDKTDYKKKFSEQSRQNQKIYAKNRKINQAIDEANSAPEPTEEELTQEYPEWDIMSDTEKKLAKQTLTSQKYIERIAKAREEGKKIEKWNEDVDHYIEDPKTLIEYPSLEGKQEEFRLFASKDENNSVPFKLLVNAFLYEQKVNQAPKKKGKMFENGSGGSSEKGNKNNGKISLAESRILMQTDYKKYKEYLLAGKITTEEIK